VTDYRNDTSQKERAEVLKNDRAVQKNTFLSHTHSEEGGRYAKPQTVIGATPTVQYPMAAPNWSVDPTGVEPPLGFDVNTVEPCGEKFEIEALGDGEAVAQSSPLAAAVAPSEVHASPAADVSAPQPTPPHQNGADNETNPSRDGEV
jgi:hypothetical protein